MALNPTKTASNPRIAKLIELEVAGRIKPEHQQELDTYRAQGLAPGRAGSSGTEGERKGSAFLTRAIGANRSYEGTGVGARGIVGQAFNDAFPNVSNSLFNSSGRQVADSAQDEFIAASLRQDSGAAIPEDELERQRRIYFPMPGDSEPAIEQKRQARLRAISGLENAAGGNLSETQRQALRPYQGAIESAVTGQQGEVVFNDQAPATASTSFRYTDEQTKALQAIAQSGGSAAQIRALAQSFGSDIDEASANNLATFYRNPKNRGVAPQVDYRKVDAIKPVAVEGEGGTAAFVRGAADTITLGALPRLGAVVDTVANGGTYAENLDRNRGIVLNDEQNYGGTRFAGQLAGGAVLPSFGATSAGQLARLGASYGGAYGVLSSDEDLTSGSGLLRAGLEAIPQAAAGAAFGYGAGRLGQYAASRGGGSAPPPSGGSELLAAAQRQGIDPIPADVGGPLTRRFTAGAAQTPFGAGPVQRAADRTQAQFGSRLSEIAASEGQPVRQEQLGEVAQTAAQRYIDDSGRVGSSLYSNARELAGDTRPVARRAVENIDQQLAELSETEATDAPLISGLQRLRADLADASGARSKSVDAIRRLRTSTRAEAQSEGLRATDYNRRSRQVVDALSEDIASQLSPDAAKAFRGADAAWADRLDTIDDVVSQVIGPQGERSAEGVANRLTALSRGDSSRFRRFIDTVNPEEAGMIRGSVIQELGRSTPGQQNAAGNQFSLATFLTNWDKLPARSRDTLFRGENRQAIEDLAQVAEGVKGTQRYANSSNTAGAVNVARTVGEGARVASTGAVLTTFGGSALLENVTGRLLGSRRFASWLARPPRAQAGKAAWVKRLGVIATREPAIANDILPLQQALSQAIPKVRAQEQERNDR